MTLSLANKYRPQQFEDVVGQERAIKILINQIARGETRQAYCFVGSAGTGKTTIARIFARALNDYQRNSEIIEIDAASNTGVDSIRELRESCKFKPINSKYKVYVIDEVHMLSTGAFNALLKTLEEPPPHAVFILATTDPQKIPATILSRVQRFDFKRMTHEQTVGRLNHIVSKEQEEGSDIAVGEDVIDYISKLAEGGMRNAISLLDTVIGYSPNPSLEDVFEIIGVPDFSEYLDLLLAIHTGDKGKVINKIESLHIAGADLKRFIVGMSEFIVDLQKIALLHSVEYSSIPSSYLERAEKGAKILGEKKLTYIFDYLVETSEIIKYSPRPKTLVKGGLISLCTKIQQL